MSKGSCNQCSHKDFCCDAIAEAIGDYFLRSGSILDNSLVNQTFLNLPADEAAARTQLFYTFLAAQNVKIRSYFDKLSKRTKCKDVRVCCVAAAKALTESAIGFLNLGYQAILTLYNPLVSPGLPILSLEELLATFTASSEKTFELILCTTTY